MDRYFLHFVAATLLGACSSSGGDGTLDPSQTLVATPSMTIQGPSPTITPTLAAVSESATSSAEPLTASEEASPTGSSEASHSPEVTASSATPSVGGTEAATPSIPAQDVLSCEVIDVDVDGVPYGLTVREVNKTCHFERFEEALTGYALEPVFTELELTQPIFMTHGGDNSGLLYVVQKGGQIDVFDRLGTGVSSSFLDISDSVLIEKKEMGLLGLAFHPDYENNGYLYVFYTTGEPTRIIISRFTRDPDSWLQVLPDSEHLILSIELEDTNHNGGMLHFGPDGYLYISLGDGGGQSDPYRNGQNTSTLQGSILRIDVDNATEDRPYAIPPDNPFADGVDGAPEIFAYGFRNTWRFSIDMPTGELWGGDVGQNEYEEINVIEKGHNYGWVHMEGAQCWRPSEGCDTEGKTLPIYLYDHSVGKSITGGYVYRGAELPDLEGQYIYGDFANGQIWALSYKDGQVLENSLLIDSDIAISSFAVDELNTLYVVDYNGSIYKLRSSEQEQPDGSFPRTLSETGCFEDVANRVPSAGVIAYDVTSPLWSDGDDKGRFFALPDCDSKLQFAEVGAWQFPDGSALFKDFSLEMVEGDPSSSRLLETRLMLKLGGTWRGYTYQWNDEQSDAILIDEARTESYEVVTGSGNVESRTHYYPSRSDCQACHTDVSGQVLGLRTGSVNRDYDFEQTSDNQLRSYEHIGLFESALAVSPDELPVYPDPLDELATLESRARSYLQANCAHCHMPGSYLRANIDLRMETALEDMNICDVEPALGSLGVSGAKLLSPGEPDLSILTLRMAHLDEYRMPPVATSQVDEQGLGIVRSWIGKLEDCGVPEGTRVSESP